METFIFRKIRLHVDEATRLKNDTMYLKYVLYNGIVGESFDKNARNCVDSLDSSGNRFYFVKVDIGSQFFLIAQATETNYRSYITFGYYVPLSYQSKTSGAWGTLKTLT